MNEKLVRDKEQADILVRQLLNIGEAMYCSGGEISRIEQSLHRLGKVYGALHVSVYALTSSIVITAEFEDNFSITQNRRITKRDAIDCSKMQQLNQLCRDCEKEPIDVERLRSKVLAILDEKPSKWIPYAGQFIAATSFALFFGGAWQDAAAAGLGVLLICVMQRWVRPLCDAQLFFHILVSFATGLLISLLNLIVPNLHVNEILIGDIMVLIPGIAITNSIRFILSGDVVSSFEKLMDSLLQAFGIASGFMLSLLLVGGNILTAPARNQPQQLIIELLSAAVGTLGFCLLFNLQKKYLLIPAAGAVLCWGSYVMMQAAGAGVFASTFVSAALVGIYGELFAFFLKVPTTILFIPACVPLVPGKNLYYSAMALIASDLQAFRSNLVLLVLYAFGIALGLAAVVELEKMFVKIRQKFSAEETGRRAE